MAKVPTMPDGTPVTVKKQDNLETLKRQRTEAREEIERIMQWSSAYLISASVLIDKLTYLKDKVLREDV